MVQRVLRRQKVQELTGLSRSTIYALMAGGRFPKPIKIAGAKAVGWLENEIAEFQAHRIAERDNRQASAR